MENISSKACVRISDKRNDLLITKFRDTSLGPTAHNGLAGFYAKPGLYYPTILGENGHPTGKWVVK